MITKRAVLKTVASVYDPLGIWSPAVVQLKSLFQEVCALNCEWDKPLNDEFLASWKKILSTLIKIDPILVPRYYMTPYNIKDVSRIEIHGFCDASKKACAAAVYFRAVFTDKNVQVHLICSKTKIVPLKDAKIANMLTIPKLELLGCVILSELVKSVKDSLRKLCDIDEVFYWTDSMDCLNWIVNSSKIWPKFIQNRVLKIRNNSASNNWFHCPGKENPADIPSRGSDLRNPDFRKCWLQGPSFLWGSRDTWPSTPFSALAKSSVIGLAMAEEMLYDESESSEKDVTLLPALSSKESPNLHEIMDINRYGNLDKLLRITSYVLRFMTSLKSKIKQP